MVVLVGDPIKTLLREKYLGQGFSPSYMTTIGADFALKEMQIRKKNIKFQVWDLAGDSRTLQSRFLYNATGAVVMINLNNRMTINSVKKWVEVIQKGCERDIPIIIACIQNNLSNTRETCFSKKEVKVLVQFRVTRATTGF